MTRIITPALQAGSQGRPGSQFTGDVYAYVTMPAQDGVGINNVTFAPGARTFWHHHERGQILQIVAGRGLFQTAGEAAQTIRAGDTIWIPAGERHWHGAAPDAAMTHVSISLGVTTWQEAVSAEDYAA